MPYFNEIAMKIIVDDKEVETSLSELNGMLKDVDDTGAAGTGRLAAGFGKAKIIALGLAAAIGAVGFALNKAVNLASDFNEANSKMLVVFKGIEKEALSMRDTLRDSYAMSYIEATNLLGATGDLMTGFGMQTEEALKLSFETQKLAADIASFSNAQGGAKAVSEALTKAYLGETESLKTYGIAIRQTDVEARLLKKGLGDLIGTERLVAKANITMAIAMEQSKNAIGDLERTSDSYANQQRRMQNRLEDLSLFVGAIVIPVWQKVQTVFLNLIEAIDPANIAKYIFQTIELFVVMGEQIAAVFDGVGDVIAGVWNMDMDTVKEGLSKLGEAMSFTFDDLAERMNAAGAEGAGMFEAFLSGSVTANSKVQEEITAKEAEELSKREQKMREQHWKFMEMVEEKIAAFNEQTVKQGEDYVTLVNLMYANDQLNFEAWSYVMDERLLTAETLYGLESIAYQKLLKEKLDMDKKNAADKKKIETGSNKASLVGMQSLGGSIRMLNSGAFEENKSLSLAQALIDTYAGATKAFGQTGIFGFISGAAIIAAGFANMAKIRATAYATGGLIDRPHLGIVGESGPEVIAPKKDFLRVTNELINSGEIGSGGSAVKEMRSLRDELANQVLIANFDASELSIIVEKGDKALDERTF